VQMIHHPGGRPAEVSGQGLIRHVDDAYLLHDIPTEEGSSGAPIFNEKWELLALHRGASPNVRGPDTAEAVPVSTFLDRIRHLL
jgi:V8-like Glu-specific endopeptidase